DIIEICDNDYAGTMTGGRILSIDAASRTLTLDREVTLPETGAATVNLCNQVNHLIPTRVLVKGGEITCKILK
ncbi:hypothetical protein K6N04_004220, partial [Escherichia coli]|nr:hypothetical protein [Escherichia coli]EKZ9302298.1 hypothetical protein [Escherichia coli]